MKKRLAQQVAVRGMPQIVDLAARPFVGQKLKDVQGNRDGDFSDGSVFGTVFDVGRNEWI